MKRRQLIVYGTYFLLGICISCDPKFPSAPTIFTGKVIDENNLPIEGMTLAMTGLRRASVSVIPTFDIETLTDKDGNFKLSYVVPKGTDFIEFLLEDSPTIKESTHSYYIQRNGKYELLLSYESYERSEFGKTITINVQIIKR